MKTGERNLEKGETLDDISGIPRESIIPEKSHSLPRIPLITKAEAMTGIQIGVSLVVQCHVELPGLPLGTWDDLL